MLWAPRGRKRGADLAVLAYHRIGSGCETIFDPGVFTADARQLEEHIGYIEQRLRIVGLEEALAIAAGRERSERPAALLTFDDGYIDNFDVAFPILQAHRVEAVFFLVSSYASGEAIPWWDRAAWMVQSTGVPRIGLTGGGKRIAIRTADRKEAVRQVLDGFKSSPGWPVEDFLRELAAACEIADAPPRDGRMFLSWEEARRMKAAGMTIAAHTHTHPILSRLNMEEQIRELEISKSCLERELGAPVDVMAYPVGGPQDFNRQTTDALAACGYRAAFSCHGGLNTAGKTSLWDIKRISVYPGARGEWLLEGMADD
jgi:peptidoglycan/xylan/chitin deacetylase (PgdA/CDA1 family)